MAHFLAPHFKSLSFSQMISSYFTGLVLFSQLFSIFCFVNSSHIVSYFFLFLLTFCPARLLTWKAPQENTEVTPRYSRQLLISAFNLVNFQILRGQLLNHLKPEIKKFKKIHMSTFALISLEVMIYERHKSQPKNGSAVIFHK